MHWEAGLGLLYLAVCCAQLERGWEHPPTSRPHLCHAQLSAGASGMREPGQALVTVPTPPTLSRLAQHFPF